MCTLTASSHCASCTAATIHKSLHERLEALQHTSMPSKQQSLCCQPNQSPRIGPAARRRSLRLASPGCKSPATGFVRQRLNAHRQHLPAYRQRMPACRQRLRIASICLHIASMWLHSASACESPAPAPANRQRMAANHQHMAGPAALLRCSVTRPATKTGPRCPKVLHVTLCVVQ